MRRIRRIGAIDPYGRVTYAYFQDALISGFSLEDYPHYRRTPWWKDGHYTIGFRVVRGRKR